MGFLAELPSDLRDQLEKIARRQSLAPGEVLALEGDACKGLYLVVEGCVKISKVSSAGREQVLLLAHVGESFADASAFLHEPMPACVVAAEKSMLYLIPIAVLDELIATEPRFARAVINHLSQKLQHVVQVVEDLSFRNVRARVAKILLQSRFPQAGLGAGIGNRALTQSDIADLAGTAREVVSRALGALENHGLIRVAHGQIEILDPQGLAAIQ